MPEGDRLKPILDRLARAEDRIRVLEKPTGTQYADSVASIVDFGSIGLSATAFTVPTDWGSLASAEIPIPDGFTRAAVFGAVSVGAWNGTTVGGYLYARALIQASPGASLPVYAGPSAYGTVPASAIRTLSGLTPGGTIPVAVQAKAAGNWGTNASNIANIDVIALFRR